MKNNDGMLDKIWFWTKLVLEIGIFIGIQAYLAWYSLCYAA